MKILSVVGARPNFMKVAPIIAAIGWHNRQDATGSGDSHEAVVKTVQHILVHTGQHYDDLMSGSFFSDLHLPKPDVHLGVGSGSHALQTAEIMKKFESVLVAEKPDVVVVVGDVNSTMACSLVAAKASLDVAGSRPLIAHVEAGLRSFDRSMPEEINRVVTDHLSDLLFVTEESGIQNLQSEGIPKHRIHFVGNTMIDSLLAFRDKADTSTILARLGLRAQADEDGLSNAIPTYGLLTLHRPSNVDNLPIFLELLAGLEEFAEDYLVVFPVHPRTRRRIEEFGLNVHFGATKSNGHPKALGESRTGILLTDPLSYLDFLCLMKHSTIVMTDSGGIQEETTCLGIPCVTLRENTERPVTVENGTNEIAGTSKDGIKQAIRRQLARQNHNKTPEKWDGQAAQRILDVLIRVHGEKSSSRRSSQLQWTTLNTHS